MGYYKNLDIKRQEEEYEAHQFAADCAEELDEARETLAEEEAYHELNREPPPGSWAETARMMASMFPDEDWDAWKDEMKDAD